MMRMLVAPILPALRFLTKPLVALILFNGVLAYIHAPNVIELMLRNEAAHLGLHLALIVSAMLMWWPVIGPIPEIAQAGAVHGHGVPVPAVAGADDPGIVPDLCLDPGLRRLHRTCRGCGACRCSTTS